MKKGFVLDDERLKELGGGGYFKELLEKLGEFLHSQIGEHNSIDLKNNGLKM